ncbi:MAG: DNA repair protein RadC [Candidatus Omnitrophica bacterium]|nr:DNA repair protein RadC [Candidatus Omnitrophota bacterium]
MPSLTVRDLPVSERPRERLIAWGPERLSAQELLACVLGRGIAGESVLVTAQRLLQAFGDLRGVRRASVEELSAVHGVGPAKAAQLKAAFELHRRADASTDGSQPPLVESSEAAIALAGHHLRGKTQEQCIALLLDSRHRLIRIAEIAQGTVNASLVHPRDIFKAAIAANATALILAHNHPSGDPAPSDEDLVLTERVVATGHLVGIAVLDHLIIGRDSHCSFLAQGWLAQPPRSRPRRRR